jgi:hypothetical protein
MGQCPTIRASELLVLATFACAPIVGCGSSNSNNSGTSSGSSSGATSGSTSGSMSGGASGAGSGTSLEAGEPDGGDAASSDSGGGATADVSVDGGDVTLTVMNFLGWCSVSINGGAASTSTSVLASVAPGSTATIVAQPASNAWVIGADPWFGVAQNDGDAAPGTDNDASTVETTTATVVVTATANTSTGTACVSVCCGDAPTGTGCPTMNPCQ